MTHSQGVTMQDSPNPTGPPPMPAKTSRGVGVLMGAAVAALVLGAGAGYLIGSNGGSDCTAAVQASRALVTDYEVMLRIGLQYTDAYSNNAYVTMEELTAQATDLRSDVSNQLDILNTAGVSCTG